MNPRHLGVASIAISAAAVAVSVSPLLGRGFGMGHDWLLELVRIAEFRHALQDGQWPPYWASNLYQGFGSPIFLFYPPLYLAVASAFGAGGADTTTAAVGALCLFSAIGAILMWRLVQDVCAGSPGAAATAVVLFSLHPYLLADKWIRNANAEFAALSLLPGVLIGACAIQPRRRFWWTAISLALVVLAHNFVALVAVAVAFGVAVFVHRSARAMVSFVAGVIAALMITAFFWVPALVMQPLIRTEDLLSGKFDFHGQFPKLAALVWPTEFYSGGWLTPALFALLLFAPIADAPARRVARALTIGAVACLAFLLPWSTWLWETLPLLRFAQFPWRFTGPLAVLLAAGAGILSAPLFRSRGAVAPLVVILAGAGLNALPAIRQYEPLAPEFTNRIQPALTPDGIRSRDLRTTVHDEYLPRGANLADVQPVDGFRLLKRWAFPVWSATRNGDSAEAETGPGGVAAVRIASESDNVALTLREPQIRRVTKWCSAPAAALLVIVAALQLWRRTRARLGLRKSRSEILVQR